MKHTHIILALVLLFTMALGSVQADVTALPQANWYAVAWAQETDTLHWINAQGEQVSIQRPQLEGEISLNQTRLHISPDGRLLLTISPLNTGREGIGLYHLEQGQWLQTHQTQENEVVMYAGQYPFTETSSHFVLSLRNQITEEWRLIVFDAMANPLVVLPRSSNMLPNGVNGSSAYPVVSYFNLDEGINMLDIHFHLRHENVDNALTPFQWYTSTDGQQQSISPEGYQWQRSGFDIHRTTGQATIAYTNPNIATAPSATAGNSIIIQNSTFDSIQYVMSEANTNIRLARWLNNGDWIGYWRENQQFQPHWVVMQNNGNNSVPLGTNFTQMHHVRDGFLTVDTSTGTLHHVTDLNFDAFSASVGNIIYQNDNGFSIIYSTPTATLFTATQVNGEAVNNIADFVPNNLGIAASCNAPTTRLTVNETARITYTDGTPLNIRTTPAGDFIMQMPEGTVTTVVDGPVCEDNYQWWNLSFNNGTGGWAAEGDFEEYYLEPFTQLELAPPVIQPTPMQVAPPVIEPTPIPFVPNNVAPPVVPPLVAVPACLGSPTSRISVGEYAHVPNTHQGTLAFRTNLSDPYPSHQIAAGTTVYIVDGPQCSDNGLRMWQVEILLNGQSVITGWLAEGADTRYYLAPGSAQ